MLTAVWECPVCGHPGLTVKPYARWPPAPGEVLVPPYENALGRPSYEVCPSCGFEFGNDDNPGTAAPCSFDQYRAEWEAQGRPWFDPAAAPEPEGVQRLRTSGSGEREAVPRTPARSAVVAQLVAEGRLSPADADDLVQDGRVGDAAWARVRPLLEDAPQEQRERFDRQVPTGSPQLSVERFEDRGIGPGGSDYDGHRYELTIGDRVFLLRRYDDEPDLVSFLAAGRVGEEPGPIRGGVPYRNRAFAHAVAYLVERLGVSRVEVLTGDPEHPGRAYVPVDLSRLQP